MEQKYKRVENLDTKIKDISLPYVEWKVLFLTAEDTSQDELGELIKENSEEISAALKSLEGKGLIELAESLTEKDSSDEEAPPEEQVELEQEFEDLAPSESTDQEGELTAESELLEGDEIEKEETLDIASEIKEETEELEDVAKQYEESLSQQEEEIEATESDKEAEASEFFKELDTSIESQEEVGQDLAGMISETETQEEEETEVETSDETMVEESEEIESPDQEEFISDVSRQSILVIDDSIVIRKMIEIALEEEDYRIITASSGAEGMEVIEKENPNLIILDMILPDMNGIEVLKKIKAEHKSPVIMLSGKDAPQLVESAKEVGVEDFLPKPFRDEELVEKIKNLLS